MLSPIVTFVSGSMKNLSYYEICFVPALSIPALQLKQFCPEPFSLFSVRACTLRRQLVRPKDKRPMEQNSDCVYRIPCSNFPVTYIGETGRHLSERLSEHKKSVEKAAAPRPFLTSLLKNSRIFIDYFMKNGMQLIENKFQSNRNDCVTLMSSIQKSTRFLSNCCDHVKFKKDAALTNHVPLLKRSLETYLFR